MIEDVGDGGKLIGSDVVQVTAHGSPDPEPRFWCPFDPVAGANVRWRHGAACRRTTRAVASAPSPLPIPGEGTAKVGRRPVEQLGEAHQGVRRIEGRGFERSRPGVGDCRDGLPREPTGLHSRTLTHHVAVRTRSSWGVQQGFVKSSDAAHLRNLSVKFDFARDP